MTTESKFINKTYFETFMLDIETKHPVQVLGEAFLAEQTKEVYDLSFIRFAQGEVYFHSKDYESAIFKWENINNELAPWAKKNIADAYYELGMLVEAEDIYTQIHTDNDVLRVEVAMQLFNLYVEREKLEGAYKQLRKAISVNPDYPEVTSTARMFYEEQEDWNHAIELAVNESIRTKSPHWFERLSLYVQQERHAEGFAPEYFQNVLIALLESDKRVFEEVTAGLWNSYKNHPLYLSWIKTINSVFLNVEKNSSVSWNVVADLHQETYLDLIDGRYLVKELEGIVPDLLSNWLKISNQSNSLFAAAAVMSWAEVFPTAISADTLHDAETRIFRYEHDSIQVNYTVELFKTLINWAKNNHLEVGHHKKWLFSQLTNLNQKHIVVTGTAQNGKTSFLNSLIGEKLLGDEACPIFIRADGEKAELNEITAEGTRVLNDLGEHQAGAIVDLKWPSTFLEEQNYSLISTSEFDVKNVEGNETLDFVPLSDGLLYVLDAQTPFTEEELHVLVKIKERAPEIPVHFVINKMDTAFHEAEATQIIEETKNRINEFFPDARVYPYSSLRAANKQHPGLATFMDANFKLRSKAVEERRTSKLLQLIRSTLTELLNSRIAMEDNLVSTVAFNEDILGRLKGFIHHLQDAEQEKIRTVSENYRAVTQEMKREVKLTIPKLLRECSSLVKEDSNFSTLHHELNEQMNIKIQHYMQEDLLPRFRGELQLWLDSSNRELLESQEYLREMSQTFNGLYKEDRMRLECDFRVIEDWRRDVNRMLSRADVEKENILNRPNTTQFLLKSAGRLFGSIQSNNQLLYNQYKKYIENERFEDVTESVIRKFFLEFDLFEKALKADVSLFYQASFTELDETVIDTEQTIENANQKLAQMKASPERYYDPLKLFEVRLLQYEFMVKVCEDNANIPTH
ncbi:GTPase SAR1 family protein [Bacillus tianshenii]|uniref:GTPase SAR1 family protein n=1 Tax=Sutcliffiella tianshenii TaxID=1463404 RepID=A0ABS2NWY7_9BACI|nr:GTP-binding protein [Bacillus tianshenii]MBM7618755.1 GTPase SAR1 family protein [Bacillus tianshenii]